MSAQPESTFAASVHKHLPPLGLLYREKMSNPYRGGTPDTWYSGSGTHSKDLWVEWKFITIPVRGSTMIDLVGGKKPIISALQQEWIRSRRNEGRRAIVIVGSKDGGVIFEIPQEWSTPMFASHFRDRLLTRALIAAYIRDQVMGKLS